LKRRVLYLGTQLPTYLDPAIEWVHMPAITVTPRPLELLQESLPFLKPTTHVILTSRYAALFLQERVEQYFGDAELLKDKVALVIGETTKKALSQGSYREIYSASHAVQEGFFPLLQSLDREKVFLFYPRSSRARARLASYLEEQRFPHHICDLYDTASLPLSYPLETIDEVVFTSPSTVASFFTQYSKFPQKLAFQAIGPITQAALERAIEAKRSALS